MLFFSERSIRSEGISLREQKSFLSCRWLRVLHEAAVGTTEGFELNSMRTCPRSTDLFLCYGNIPTVGGPTQIEYSDTMWQAPFLRK
jgi:hypothetical protein